MTEQRCPCCRGTSRTGSWSRRVAGEVSELGRMGGAHLNAQEPVVIFVGLNGTRWAGWVRELSTCGAFAVVVVAVFWVGV